MKWRNQRDRYKKEKNKIGETSVSGAGSADVYISKWPMFKIFDNFMHKFVEQSER